MWLKVDLGIYLVAFMGQEGFNFLQSTHYEVLYVPLDQLGIRGFEMFKVKPNERVLVQPM